jgi:SH3-like domain-containing protein
MSLRLAVGTLLLLLADCSRRKRLPVIGEAYVAPISLNLRQDLAPRSTVVGTIKHGDRVEILARRRRFAKVRIANDVEGWVDSRQLLSTQGMQRLKRFHAWARRQPSQGRATPLDTLNVHIDANRYAPSFAQISPEETAEIVGRVVTQRGPYSPDASGMPEPLPEAPNAVKDDWSLVRLAEGRSGWVLSRMMTMNLPESVAVFSQGHRITSFHQLGVVRDRRGRSVNSYLWTTSSVPPDGFNYDRFRVTMFNTRTRRFETGHIESNIRGHYPITVHTPPDAPVQRFTLIYAEGKGPAMERTFEMADRKVKLLDKKPWTPPSNEMEQSELLLEEDRERPPSTAWERLRATVKGWTGL